MLKGGSLHLITMHNNLEIIRGEEFITAGRSQNPAAFNTYV